MYEKMQTRFSSLLSKHINLLSNILEFAVKMSFQKRSYSKESENVHDT